MQKRQETGKAQECHFRIDSGLKPELIALATEGRSDMCGVNLEWLLDRIEQTPELVR